VVAELFGYRFEATTLGELLHTQGVDLATPKFTVPLETRIEVAHYGAPRAAK